MSHLPVLVHDGLQDGGEGRDSDARPNQDGVRDAEDLSGGGAVGAIHVHLGKGRRV